MSMLSRYATLSPGAVPPIQFVGSTSLAVTGSTSTTTTISLTSLTGGLTTSPAADDLVVVYYGCASTANRALTITTSGYTQVADLYANDTFDANLTVAYKRMPFIPDTEVVVSATGATTDAGAVVVQVWRGVDKAFPFDVTATTATGIDDGDCDPPSITPVTANSVIIVGGATAHGQGTFLVDFTSNDLGNFVSQNGPNATNDVTVGVGSKYWTSGAFDPQPFNFNGNAFCSWAAVTLALLPQQAQIGPFIISEQSTQRATAGTSLVINKPTGTREGDLMIAFMNIPANSTWTGDTGWTEVADQGTNPSTRIAYKVAGASEGASYTFTSSASSTSSGTIVTYRNAAYDAVGTITSAINPLVLSAVTASAKYSRILATLGRATASITIGGPATMDNIRTDNDAVGPSRLVEQDINLIDAVSSGTRSFTMGSATNVSGALVAIKPAASYTKYVSYINSNSATAGIDTTYSTTVTNNTPTCLPGHLLIWAVCPAIDTNTNITVSTPSGWVLLSGNSTSTTADQPGMYIFYRVADGTEAASYIATASTACVLVSSIIVLAGADYTTLKAGTSNIGSITTSITATEVAASANGILLYFGAQANPDVAVPSFTPPSGMTEVIDTSANNNNEVISLEVAYQEGLSAGSTGNKTATSSTVEERFRALLVTVAGK